MDGYNQHELYAFTQFCCIKAYSLIVSIHIIARYNIDRMCLLKFDVSTHTIIEYNYDKL